MDKNEVIWTLMAATHLKKKERNMFTTVEHPLAKCFQVLKGLD